MYNKQILTEIGELFGRYQKADGSYELFTNLPNAQNPAVEERKVKNLVDKIPFFNGILYTQYNLEGPQRYYNWQQNVISELENGNDVYVVAPAGGGKTRPLFGYWIINKFLNTLSQRNLKGSIHSLEAKKLFDNYSPNNSRIIENWANIISGLFTGRLLNGNSVSKLLLVTPIRVLAFEQANGLQDVFLDLFLFIKTAYELFVKKYLKVLSHKNLNFNQKMDALIQKSENTNSLGNTGFGIYKCFGLAFRNNENAFEKIALDIKDYESFIKTQTVKKLICVKTGGGSEPYSSDPNNAIVSIATYGSAKNFIKNVASDVKFIVFDEAQNECVQ